MRAVLRLALALLHGGGATVLMKVAWTADSDEAKILATIAALLVVAGGSLFLGGPVGA